MTNIPYLLMTLNSSYWAFQVLSGKEFARQAGDTGSILGSGRSPIDGNSDPLQHSCLGSLTDRGAWYVAVHGVVKKSDMT